MKRAASSLRKIDALGDRCCGCGACAASCRKSCISMVSDSAGFKVPVVDGSACIECGKCDAVCPMLNEREEDACRSILWAKSNNSFERERSSSGGIFALLAREILCEGGLVAGAAWESDCKRVRHVAIESESELDRLMRSKYVQSSMEKEVYEAVRLALRADRHVLFSGTACQVAAIRSYLGKLADSELLLTMDVICHGVPSPLLWERWATYRESCVGARLSDVNMRSKKSGWISFSSTYKYVEEKEAPGIEDGSRFDKDWYMKAFLANASLRSSCFSCAAKRNSGSDITLGDFWGFMDFHPEVDCEKGVSAVICNTGKGEAAIQKIASLMEWGPSSLGEVLPGNPCLVKPVAPYAERDAFMADIADNTPISMMMKRWGFAPSLSQRIIGKAASVKRRLCKVLNMGK